MAINIKIIGIPDISQKEIKIDLKDYPIFNMVELLEILPNKLNINLNNLSEKYILMLNSRCINSETLIDVAVNDEDIIEILPMIYGG